MRITESSFQKRSNRRASATGVGGRSYPVEDLMSGLGLSQRAIQTLRELYSARLPSDEALRYAVQVAEPALYRRIDALGDGDHTTFRSKLRLYRKTLARKHPKT